MLVFTICYVVRVRGQDSATWVISDLLVESIFFTFVGGTVSCYVMKVAKEISDGGCERNSNGEGGEG